MKINIKFVAGITTITGLFQIYRHGWRSYSNFFTNFLQFARTMGPRFWIMGSVLMLVPILKLLSAFGLLKSTRWGWGAAIVALTLDFVFGLQLAVRMCALALTHSVEATSLDVPINGHVQRISLWPTYIIAIISIASVLVLIRNPIARRETKDLEFA